MSLSVVRRSASATSTASALATPILTAAVLLVVLALAVVTAATTTAATASTRATTPASAAAGVGTNSLDRLPLNIFLHRHCVERGVEFVVVNRRLAEVAVEQPQTQDETTADLGDDPKVESTTGVERNRCRRQGKANEG